MPTRHRPDWKGTLQNHKFSLGVASQSEVILPQKWLSPAELKLRRSYLSDKRQLNFLLGRVAAKRSVAALGEKLPAAKACLVPGVFGQPTWTNTAWETSITHSSTLAFAVSAPAALPLTVDLETLDDSSIKRAQALSKRLAPAEKNLFTGNPSAFLGLWSAKECLGKMLRTGISVSPGVLEVAAVKSHGAAREITFASFPQFKVSQWEFGGWLFSLLTPKESTIPGELVAWLGGQLLR